MDEQIVPSSGVPSILAFGFPRPNPYAEDLTPKMIAIRDGEVIRFRWGHEGGPPVMGVVPLEEEEDRTKIFLSTGWAHSEGVAIYKPGRRSSSEPSHAGTMVSDFRLLELWEIIVCCLSLSKSMVFCYNKQPKLTKILFSSHH